MKFRTRHSPLLLLLLPALANALSASIPDTNDDSDASAAFIKGVDSVPPPTVKGRHGVPTKDAPVDGKDGKPHLGPFVGSETGKKSDHQDLPPLKGRPDDPTIVDGKKIPETNDGVMFDKNRERPQEGTTGTEGGVSEKDKTRRLQEGRTGEKVVTQPESPKEQPPLPHSEEAKLLKDKTKQSPDDDSDGTSYTGLDVRLALDPAGHFQIRTCSRANSKAEARRPPRYAPREIVPDSRFCEQGPS